MEPNSYHFLKNNELYKQCREHLLSSSAMRLPWAPSTLAGSPDIWPLRTDTPPTHLFAGWLNHLFFYLLQPTWPQEASFSLNIPCIHRVLSCLQVFFLSIPPAEKPSYTSKIKTHFLLEHRALVSHLSQNLKQKL